MRCAGMVAVLALVACGDAARTAPRPAVTAPAPATARAAGDLEVLPLVSRPGVDDRDPLPPGVISRIGTLRFRADEYTGVLRFLGDVVMHEDNDITGFDLATGKRRFTVDKDLTMALSEDGRLGVVLSFEDDCQGLALFELPSGERRACRRERDSEEFEPGNWAVSDDGYVFDEVDDNALRVLDARLLDVATIVEPGAEEVAAWAISADGAVLAVVWEHPENRHQLRLYRMPEGEPLPLPRGLVEPAGPVALSANGQILAMQGDADVRVVDRRTGRLLATLPLLGSRMKLSRDGALLAQVSFAGDRASVIMWEVAGGRRLWTHALGGFSVYADDHDFSTDGARFAYLISNVIRVVDARTGLDPAGIGGPVGIDQAALSPDGRRVATASLGWVAVWDADTGALLRSFRTDERFDGLQFALDGRSVYGIVGTTELVQFPVAAAGAPVRQRLPGCGGERSMQRPDGRTWILECDDGVAVWQARPPRTLRRVKVPTRDAVHAIAMDPAGTRVAIASDDMAHGDVPSGSLRVDVIDIGTGKVQTTSVAMSVQDVTMAALPDGTILLDETLLDPVTGTTTRQRAGVTATSTDRATVLMSLVEEPGGLFPWRLDRPLAIPTERAPRGAWNLYPRGLSSSGRLLECDRHSTCQVRILR